MHRFCSPGFGQTARKWLVLAEGGHHLPDQFRRPGMAHEPDDSTGRRVEHVKRRWVVLAAGTVAVVADGLQAQHGRHPLAPLAAPPGVGLRPDRQNRIGVAHQHQRLPDARRAELRNQIQAPGGRHAPLQRGVAGALDDRPRRLE